MEQASLCESRASCLSPEQVAEIQARLSRLEGHIQAIRRMLSEGRDCRGVLIQVAAVKSALNQVAIKLLEGYLDGCVATGRAVQGEPLDALKAAMAVALKFS
ncbi:MAG: metal-sensitive transcriptional regulator [Chloroflexia bacterium]